MMTYVVDGSVWTILEPERLVVSLLWFTTMHCSDPSTGFDLPYQNGMPADILVNRQNQH